MARHRFRPEVSVVYAICYFEVSKVRLCLIIDTLTLLPPVFPAGLGECLALELSLESVGRDEIADGPHRPIYKSGLAKSHLSTG